MIWIVLLTQVFLMAMMVAFVILLFDKWEVWNWLAARAPKWTPFGCQFCLSFWLSVLIVILAVWFKLLPWEWQTLLAPMLVTTATRIFIK